MSSTQEPWHVSVPGGPDAPARARHAVSGELDGALNPERKADLCLLLHELVANCVMHAGADASATIDVLLTVADETVRVDVTDHGSASVPAVLMYDAGREGGRGLRLVEDLSDVWGMRREGINGTTMWFEVWRDGPPLE